MTDAPILGANPGLSGAIAIIDTSGEVPEVVEAPARH